MRSQYRGRSYFVFNHAVYSSISPMGDGSDAIHIYEAAVEKSGEIKFRGKKTASEKAAIIAAVEDAKKWHDKSSAFAL